MFVMTVGILGLAALIPVGGSDVATAVRNDRTSNLGRAAFRDVQVRDWLEPDMWLDYRGIVPAAPGWADHDYPDGVPLPNSPLDYGNAFCIDPLLVARFGGTDARIGMFPYEIDNDVLMDGDGDNTKGPNPSRMTRGTLRAWPSFTATAIQLSQAERLFRSTDDLIFGLPDNQPDGRPFASLGSAQQVRQYTGDYSWLITVAPLMNETTLSNTVTAGAPQMYTVSVVVFQKRTLELAPEQLADRAGTPPTERTVYCDFISGVGLGGGDVRLGLPVTAGQNDKPNLPKLSDFPPVKPGQWIMLSGWTRTMGAMPVYRSPVFRWYRVVNAGPLQYEGTPGAGITTRNNPEWAQYVTLAGPDWWSGATNILIDADAPPNVSGLITAHAAIIDGVVGVYEKTMRLDTRAFGVR
jgi:hypothetical protein